MPGDLHTHTTFSDGSTPADKLPFLAACAGMTHLAISDHDSIRSVRYAYAHPVQNGVHLIPATELTAYDYERAHRVHLLCYWPDDCAALADFSAMMAERRLTAMLQSCKELEAICPQFRTEEALELAKDSGTLFKAQVMRVLWQYGLADGMYNTVYKSLFGLKPAGASCTRRGMSRWIPCWMSLRQAAQWSCWRTPAFTTVWSWRAS